MDCFSIVVSLIMQFQTSFWRLKMCAYEVTYYTYMLAWNLLFISMVQFFYYSSTQGPVLYIMYMFWL